MTPADRKLIAELRAAGMHAEADQMQAALAAGAKVAKPASAETSTKTLMAQLVAAGLFREAHELRVATYAQQHPRSLAFTSGSLRDSWTAKLVEGPLFPRSSGSQDAALRQAGFLAARDGEPYVVYWGPALGGKGQAWHASSRIGMFANETANTGKVVYLVLPDLSVYLYEVQHRPAKE